MDKNSIKIGDNTVKAVNSENLSVKALSAAIFAGCMMLGSQNVQAAELKAEPVVLTTDNSLDNTRLDKVSSKDNIRRSRDRQSNRIAKEDINTATYSISKELENGGMATGFAAEAPAILGDEGTVEFLQEKPIDTPTLDYLHENNVKIPQKTVDSSGNLVDGGTPILAPESGYSLTEVQTAGDNVITKYETVEVTRYYDKTTGEFVSDPVEGGDYKVMQEKDLVLHCYKVNVPTSELGGSLGTSSNISWQKVGTAGDNTVSVTLPNGTTEYYQYTYTTPDGYDTTTYSGQTNDLGTIENPAGTRDAHSIYGGGILNNPSGTTTSLENYLFKDNKTSVTFKSTTSGAKYADLLGGTIYNAGEITRITSDFVGNGLELTVNSTSGDVLGYAMGGAIANVGTIGDITGDFIGNYAQSTSSEVYGGAISNYASGSGSTATIGDITGDFIGNYAQSTSSYSRYAKGGAIYNYTKSGIATIRDITGDFIGNYAKTKYYAEGGAIYNYAASGIAKIGNITGDFIGNYAHSTSSQANGGAIYNYAYNSSANATIGNITGDFIGNYAKATSSEARGGAISNISATIGNITGDFIGNYAQSTSSSAYGGAIYNYAYSSNSTATIGDITGDFIGNYVQGYFNAVGGAIWNSYSSTIGNITGNFIGNYAKTTSENAEYTQGGAIYNSGGTIGNITGDFIGNYAQSTSTYAYGGAIYNFGYNSNATIGDITGDFIGNYAQGSSSAQGGAIYNSSVTTGAITGDFIGNYAQGDEAYGGAIYNYDASGTVTIGAITGDFIGNYTLASSYASGGAIYNYAESEIARIGDITGDFIGNYAQSTSDSASGGAISNYAYAYNSYYTLTATIGDITGDFIGNYAQGSSSAKGGAIYNYADSGIATIGDITGDFIGNYAQGSYYAYGGAISNENGTIGDITGDFIGNYAQSTSDSAYGGAIYNYNATIGDITGDFIGNYAYSSSGTAQGGAIWTNKNLTIKADNGTSEFTGNYVQVGNGEKDYQAIYAAVPPTGTTSQSASSLGLSYSGTVYTSGAATPTITFKSENNGSIIMNDKIAAEVVPSPLYRWNKSYANTTIDGTSRFVYTYRYLDGDYNTTDEYRYCYDFASTTIDGASIRVYTYQMINPDNTYSDKYRYYSTSASTSVDGTSRSVYTYHMLNEDNTESETYRYWYESSNGIYTYHILDENNNEIRTIKSPDDFIVAVNHPITSYEISNSTIAFTGDSTGHVYLNNNIEAISKDNGVTNSVDVTLDNVTLHLGVRDNVLDGNNLILNSGMLSMVNNQVGVSALNSLTVNGDTNFVADVDLANQTMDRFSANEYGNHSGNLNVVGMNLLSDATQKTTEIFFAEQGLKDNVVNGVADNELPQENIQTTLFTPIYKYKAMYDNREDGGYFVFTRGSGGSGGDYNPSVVASPVASQAGATATMNQTFNYAFQHTDNFMNIPYLERIAIKNANKYAISPTGDATDVGTYSPLFTKNDNASVWVKPYASFENIPLKNGPKVSNITYGTLIGYDTELIQMKHGWDRVWTGYIGYNGASQRYSGVNSTQNGGLLGGTLTLYKGNFFNATTISAGASVAENTNMYGHENFSMLLAGIGNKAGYNFEFKEGKIIIQPSLLMSYTFVNTFDYTNAAGVRIKSDPLHSIQLSPGVKFIGNTKNGWQPYASVGMVWNLLNETKVTANNVTLPQMSIKPYVQYGVGVQKRFKDKCMAFGQAMIQNGGRNGISLTAGFRWSLGKEGKPIEKVQAEPKKLLSTEQQVNHVKEKKFNLWNFNKKSTKEVSATNDYSNTSNIGHKTVLKQLTPTQKATLNRQNTSRTTNIGIIK